VPKKAKDILISLDEMAGLSQVIVVDSSCDGLIAEVLKISKKTDIRRVKTLTSDDSPSDEEIHDALQELGIRLLVFVTKKGRHFHNLKLRSEAKYYLIWISNEETYNDSLAKNLVFALRHDPDLKEKRTRGRYPIVYLTQNYMKDLKNLVRKPPTRKTKRG